LPVVIVHDDAMLAETVIVAVEVAACAFNEKSELMNKAPVNKVKAVVDFKNCLFKILLLRITNHLV
jgi:hypothetical protein